MFNNIDNYTLMGNINQKEQILEKNIEVFNNMMYEHKYSKIQTNIFNKLNKFPSDNSDSDSDSENSLENIFTQEEIKYINSPECAFNVNGIKMSFLELLCDSCIEQNKIDIDQKNHNFDTIAIKFINSALYLNKNNYIKFTTDYFMILKYNINNLVDTMTKIYITKYKSKMYNYHKEICREIFNRTYRSNNISALKFILNVTEFDFTAELLFENIYFLKIILTNKLEQEISKKMIDEMCKYYKTKLDLIFESTTQEIFDQNSKFELYKIIENVSDIELDNLMDDTYKNKLENYGKLVIKTLLKTACVYENNYAVEKILKEFLILEVDLVDIYVNYCKPNIKSIFQSICGNLNNNAYLLDRSNSNNFLNKIIIKDEYIGK